MFGIAVRKCSSARGTKISNLVMVSEVIDSNMLFEVGIVKYFLNPTFVCPDEVPFSLTKFKKNSAISLERRKIRNNQKTDM